VVVLLALSSSAPAGAIVALTVLDALFGAAVTCTGDRARNQVARAILALAIGAFWDCRCGAAGACCAIRWASPSLFAAPAIRRVGAVRSCAARFLRRRSCAAVAAISAAFASVFMRWRAGAARLCF